MLSNRRELNTKPYHKSLSLNYWHLTIKKSLSLNYWHPTNSISLKLLEPQKKEFLPSIKPHEEILEPGTNQSLKECHTSVKQIPSP